MTTKISSKYQVVIPQKLRESMNLHEGQVLYAERINDTQILLSTTSVLERYAGTMPGLWGDDPAETLRRDRDESDRSW